MSLDVCAHSTVRCDGFFTVCPERAAWAFEVVVDAINDWVSLASTWVSGCTTELVNMLTYSSHHVTVTCTQCWSVLCDRSSVALTLILHLEQTLRDDLAGDQMQ